MMTNERQTELTEKINRRADEFQEQCHDLTTRLMLGNTSLEYQDCVNVFIIRKLAQLETYMLDVVDELRSNESDKLLDAFIEENYETIRKNGKKAVIGTKYFESLGKIFNYKKYPEFEIINPKYDKILCFQKGVMIYVITESEKDFELIDQDFEFHWKHPETGKYKSIKFL